MRTDTYSYEGRGYFSNPARTAASLLPLASLLLLSSLTLPLSGCGKENAIVLSIRPPSGVVLTEYALTVQDRKKREIVYQSGVQPVDAVAQGRDLNAEPLRVGLKLVSGETFLVHVRASTEKLAPEGVVAPNPRTPEYFFAGITTAQGIVELDAALLLVGPGYDRDFDHFPDAGPWMGGVPEAQMRYADHLELLDCVDRDPAPGDPPLPVPYYAVQINPLATPKCGLALDIACESSAPACKDSDGDGENEATDCDDNDAKRFHGNPRPRNCCQCTDRKSCETNHAKLADTSTCQPARCDDPFDFDCSGQTVGCFTDEDCDGFSPNDPIASLRDCDDTNPDVHPGAPKNCADSSKDWACDGAPTAGCTPCDLDGDGFQRNDAANSCPTANYGSKPYDCDDNDRGVFPGSTTFEGVSLIIRNLPAAGNPQEGGGYIAMALRGTCRNRAPAYPVFQNTLISQDADCDGNARRGCPTAACDVDGDGFPNANAGCNPMGLPVDCNDGDFKIFPGAPERCADGVAQGCSADIPCTNDADGDGYTATYDCDDGNANVHPWATESCNGVDDDCDGLIDEGNPDQTGAPLTKTYGSLQGIRDCADDNDGECGRRNGQNALSGRCVCTGIAPTGIVDSANRTACPGNASGTTIGPKCFGATQPKLQTCIASQPRDEDCNGSNEAPTGINLVEKDEPCGNNTGECRAGVVTGCRRTGYVNPFYTGAGTPPVPVSPAFDPERRFLVCSSAARPPAVETCDNKDNDCNAVIDQTCTELSGANTPACCLVSMAPVCKDLNSDFNFCGTCTNQCNAATADRCTNKACKCGTSNPCSGTTPVCKAGGTCVQCVDDTTCGGAKCKVTTNTCVQCLSNADCGAGTPACDLATNTCVACVDNTTCAAPTPVCNTTSKTCVQCLDDSTCGMATPKCKTMAQMCVQCLADGDCMTAAQSNCDNANACTMCSVNAECSHIAGKPFCKAGVGCAQCLMNSTCTNAATSLCDATGTCAGCAVNADCTHITGKSQCKVGTGCVQCVANAQCTTAALSKCGAGDACAICAAAADCTHIAGRPACKAGTGCVQCTTDANCMGGTPICNTTTNMCRACTNNTDCMTKDATKPVCDTGTGQCHECVASSDCTADDTKPICDPAMFVCRACGNSAECLAKDPLNPICNAGNGKCM